ncbi:adenosylcobinamide-phosphate synthase CbiB [Jannaschia sp. S6380]|uniref:adenosylcobinamide-phosphate synthase CbiB n=1 Tax=Jannaschia sp. S6380 TaxID=2926408 RepID=UPI001FF56217|nr:adenosylcobinamide-phosphate synthase CbiB [Jannaschia sp. S6380]MCK0169210.1 adenosylcobinamide-phosphate synthase CbiB [Jannaschia sp. S6380]
MILPAAMILDAWFGEPDWLWSRVPHPAALAGRAIAALDRRLNRGTYRRAKGVLTVFVLTATAALTGWVIAILPDFGLIETIAAAILLAHRSLIDHVRAVADGLRISVRHGRDAVARIVGRDTTGMDSADVARAAIESGAENLSDGVIAPLFWYAIAGLPGMMVYKVVNTADSMIGYRTPRHAAFGWAAARLDDILNWVPARLTAALILLANFAPHHWHRVPNDAHQHRSPNAGWPEAAMAPLLDISLSGPRSYDGAMQDFPWVNPTGRKDVDAGDIDRACTALWRTWGAALVIAVVLALL